MAQTAEQLVAWTAREQRVIDAGGFALPPDADWRGAGRSVRAYGMRTLPPRENGGNFDVKQLTKGARLLLPVFKEGETVLPATAISRRATARCGVNGGGNGRDGGGGFKVQFVNTCVFEVRDTASRSGPGPLSVRSYRLPVPHWSIQ